MHRGMSSVNNGSDLTNIGLPHSVGFAVGVRDVLTEDDALSADITLCHYRTPPSFIYENIKFHSVGNSYSMSISQFF